MNIAWSLLAIAAAFVTGWFLLRILWPADQHHRDPAAFAVRICLALGLGQAVAAVHYLLWRAACSHVGLPYKLTDCLLVPIVAWLAAHLAQRMWPAERNESEEVAPLPSPPRLCVGILLIVTALVASAALCICLAQTCDKPLGEWDGWAIWNLKARFMFRGGADWTGMFSRHIWFSHPDYPLFIPASVARFWTYLQGETTVVPQLVSVAFATLVVGLLFASLAWLRGLVPACLGTLLLVSYEPFLVYGGAQMSDIPLSFYVLAAVVAVAIAGRLLVLSGVLIGCALIVKNEAQPILLALLVGLFVVPPSGGPRSRLVVPPSGGPRNRLKAVLRTLLGATPFLLVVAAQKLFFAGASYLVADQPSAGAFLHKIIDPARHRTIIEFLVTWNFGFHLWHPFWRIPLAIPLPDQPSLLLLLAIPIVCGLRPDPRDRPAGLTVLIAVALTFILYYAVFLVMPYDLRNLMESFPRVQLHFLPALIFAVLLLTANPAACSRDR
ncbi:MAG: hypothetical protein ACHRHE_10445 [Tepidisphaerales bacterium]